MWLIWFSNLIRIFKFQELTVINKDWNRNAKFLIKIIILIVYIIINFNKEIN